MSRRHGVDPPLICSFCSKSQDTVQKLICNPPGSTVRAYICDECLAVCASILADDDTTRFHPLLGQPITNDLLHAVERRIKKEKAGEDANAELDDLRTSAVRWVGYVP